MIETLAHLLLHAWTWLLDKAGLLHWANHVHPFHEEQT